MYSIVLENEQIRDELQKFLKENNIACGIHYPIPLHLQQAYKYMNLPEGSFPISEEYAKTMLSLPMFPELSEEQIKYVVGKIKEFFELIN